MRRGSKIAWGAIGIVVLAVVVWQAVAVWTARLAVEKEISLFLADGGAMRLADMAPRAGQPGGPTHYVDLAQFTITAPEQPSSRVAVRFNDPAMTEAAKTGAAYEQALSWKGLWLEADPRSAEWNSEWEPYLDKHLDANAAALAYVKEQAALGTGGFEVDWTRGFNVLLPHLSHMRKAARALSLEAVLRAKRGDAAGAYEDVRLMFRLRKLCAAEPTLIARLVAMALDSIAISTLHGALTEARIDRASAQALLAELEGFEKRNSMTRVFLGETTMGVEMLEKARRDPAILLTLGNASGGPGAPVPAPNRLALKAYRLIWNASADQRQYLKLMRQFRELSSVDFTQRKTDPLAALPRGPLDMLRAPFTHMMTPALGRVLDQQVMADAKIAMARAAIGLELYRAENGAYPETLEALVPGYLPAVPMDPFDLKPVRYRPSEDDFTLYTVGIDGQDQGGARNANMLWVRKPQIMAPMVEAPETP